MSHLKASGRAPLDWTRTVADAIGMEQRIEQLEREVCAIKTDVAVIKSTYWAREDARGFDTRVAHLETDVRALQEDVAQLKIDVAQLKIDAHSLRSTSHS